MRKLLMAIVTVALFALAIPAAPPALAAGDNCQTFTNNAGGKKVQICISVASSSFHWWARLEYHDVTGYDLPYAVNGQAKLWSRRHDDTPPYNYCEGRATSCNGAGNATLLVTNLTHAGAPYTTGTEHYTNSEHYCNVHGEVHGGGIWWTQSAWSNGTPFDPYSFNTIGGDIWAVDDCIA